MKNRKIYLPSSFNRNKYMPNSNFRMNPRLDKKHQTNTSINTNYYVYKNNMMYRTLDINKSTSRKISHRDFHNNIQIGDYKTNSLQSGHNNKFKNEDFYKKKKMITTYEKSSSIEKDLDIMKIQMSCDLITYKINQIKNKVQDLHESSIKDDEDLLNKNKKNNTREIGTINNFNKINYRKINLISNNIKPNRNQNKDNYIDNNMVNSLGDNYIMPIYTENTNGIDNTYNCCMNIENRINNFRISNNDKIQFLNLNQKKKYNPNKNVLKYILINSNNQQNASTPINNSNSNLDSKNSNIVTNNENSFSNINKKEDVIYEFNHKRNYLSTEPNHTNNNLKKKKITNKNNINYITKDKEMKRNAKKKWQANSFSSNGIRYGSYDKYFINNNNNNYEENSFLNNNNNSNKLLYNKKKYNIKKDSFNKDKFEQIKEINKMLNKNKNVHSMEKKNDIDAIKGKNIIFKKANNNNNDNDNKYNLNLSVQGNGLNYFNNLNQFIKEKSYNNNTLNKNNSNNNRNGEHLEINKGIKNFNYYLNKEGDIFQNNYINNNFNLKNNKKVNRNNNNNNNNINKQMNKTIPFKNIKKENKKINKNIIMNNNDNDNININNNNAFENSDRTHNKKYILNKNYKMNINNDSKYLNKKNSFNNNSKILNKLKQDINNSIKNKSNDITNNTNLKKAEKLKMNNDYSKDDILRMSLFNKDDNILNKKNNNLEIKKENIFDILLQEEIKEGISPKSKSNKKDILNIDNDDNEIINNYSDRNTISNKKFFNKIKNDNKNLNKLIRITDKKNISDNNNNKLKKINNINIQKIIQYNGKKVKPRQRELCHKFINNPQHFYTIKLNELMLKTLNLKKNINTENRNKKDLISEN